MRAVYVLILVFMLVPSSFEFTPTDHYLINSGSYSPSTLNSDHRLFSGDFSDQPPATQLFDPDPQPGSDTVLNAARVFSKPGKYVFDVKQKGMHLVKLHFKGFRSGQMGLDYTRFHVSANGFVLLYDFSVNQVDEMLSQQHGNNGEKYEWTENNGENWGIVKDYVIWVDKNELVVTFTPSKGSKYAFINAIEVISAPKDLVSNFATILKGKNVENVALETVYRVNVGGFKVTPFNDSLWRTWVPDEEFLKTSGNSKIVRFGGRIKYRNGGASREIGPDNVYNSARVVSSEKDSILGKNGKDLSFERNIMWEFPVMGGYNYIVRLHFCDITSVSLGMIYFNVYLNGDLVYENVDLSGATGWVLASPFYADFVVDGTKGLSVLSVGIGPSNRSLADGVDGILNGIEIFKMNNSMGSLDGEVCVESISMNWNKGGGNGCLVPLVVILCLLVIASLMMHRRWDRIKDSVTWAPLPVSEVDLKSEVRSSLGK